MHILHQQSQIHNLSSKFSNLTLFCSICVPTRLFTSLALTIVKLQFSEIWTARLVCNSPEGLSVFCNFLEGEGLCINSQEGDKQLIHLSSSFIVLVSYVHSYPPKYSFQFLDVNPTVVVHQKTVHSAAALCNPD